jgi:hypothetical protein
VTLKMLSTDTLVFFLVLDNALVNRTSISK